MYAARGRLCCDIRGNRSGAEYVEINGEKGMSLQVWLPLTKDLRNQGLSNVTVTNNGATFNSAGKLGGCYNLTNGPITISNLPNPQAISIAFWFKRTANTETRQFMFTAWTGVTCELTTDGKPTFAVNRNSYPTITGNAITTSTGWVHYCGTFSQTEGMKLYINGSLMASNSNTSAIVWGTTTGQIGKYGSYASMSAQMNDFRIYDHCLSPMEVKELSKGLVLHYPLNRGGWGQENLIVTNSMTPTSGTSGWSSAGTGWANTNVTSSGASNGHAIRCTYSGTTQTSGGIHHPTGVDKTTLANGATYTLSARIRASKACTASFQNELMTKGNTINLTTNWQVYSYSCAIDNTKTYQSNVIYVRAADATQNMWIECDWIKLEAGDKATPWCPNSSDALATTMGLNGTTEYDCSGYCNNGTRTGTFSWTSNTPKYGVSTHIGSTSSKIHISDFPTSGFGNTYSFAWWGKRNSNSPMFWGFSNGIRLNGMYTGTLWNTGDGSDNPIYKPNTTTTITAPSLNVWHHYVMTGDGSACKLYVDGELYGQAKTYKAISGTSIYINGWDSGTSYCSDNTDISDFRIYATALSASDVKSLYQNSAYIDSSGNVYGAVHEEG